MNKIIKIALMSLMLLSSFTAISLFHNKAKADTYSLELNISESGTGCSAPDTFSGSSTLNYYYPKNYTLNITLNNKTPDPAQVYLKGGIVDDLTSTSSKTYTFTEMNGFSISCGYAAGTQATLSISEASQATLSCSISGTVWNVNVGYVSDVNPHTYMHGITGYPINSSGNIINAFTTQFHAQNSDTVYTVYDGPDATYPILAQTTCPAYVAPTVNNSSSSNSSTSSSKSSASTASTTTATTTSSTPTASMATTTSSTPTASMATTTSISTKGSSIMTPISKSDKKTSIYKNIVIIILLISFILTLVLIVSNWKIYVKAGRPGWVSLIPVYGTWILFELLGYNPWLSLLVLIPIINIIPAFMIVFGLARVFGKSKLFAFFGLFIFNFVGYPMLAFGKAQYKKPNINK